MSEADIGKIQAGQPVTFSVTAYPNQTFTGTVAAIEPAGTTSSNVVTYTVLIAVDPTAAQLLPAMTATATIVTQAADDTLLVPVSALSYAGGGGTMVDVLRDGAVTPVQVQTGITDGVSTQVLAGLAAGDQVVTGAASSSSAAGKSSSSTSGTRSILSTSGGPPTGGGAPSGGSTTAARPAA